MPAGPALPWLPLPKGGVTGIAWSEPQTIDGADPYLAWAEADRFSGYRLGADQAKLPRWLPIVIELAADAEVIDLVRASQTGWLQIPPAYLGRPGLRFCSARAGKGFFTALRQQPRLRHLVQRYELGLPVAHHAGPLANPATATALPTPVLGKLSGKVLGLIDGGLALAHADFLSPDGTPRVRHFWRQDDNFGGDAAQDRRPLDPARAGPTPEQMGYGHEITGAALQAAMAAHSRGGQLDEDALYQHLQLWDLNHTAHHGTHVMSLACGPRRLTDTLGGENTPPVWRPANDDASRCELIAVQLDWSNVVDTSGGALNVSVLDGLLYILSRCADDAQVVVNISWGTLAGPHDGTSVLEAAMDQLIALSGGRLQIVVPAGNGYQSRTHANQTLAPGQSVTLGWRVQPDDQTQSFLELWLGDPALPAEPVRDVTITVQPPGLDALPAMLVGEAGIWPSATAPACALIFPQRSALGTQATCALLALAPTFSHDAAVTTAPFGLWQVTVTNNGLNPLVLDAYVERDDMALGTHTGARQSYLEDACYDTSGGLESFIDDTDNPTPVRRSGTFNSLSTGARTVAVGGIRHAASAFDPFARYSPRVPDPDASRPQRPGVKRLPARLAVSDDSAVLWGVRGAGSRSGSVVRLAGTSAAAPQVARDLLNSLQGSNSGQSARPTKGRQRSRVVDLPKVAPVVPRT